MVKISSNDALAVLRRFKVANDENSPRQVEQLIVSNPSPINTLAEFRFLKQRYHLLFDDTAEDDGDYIIEQLTADNTGRVLTLCPNPNDHITTYALPFKGKDVYLLVEKSNKVRLDQELARRYPEHSRSTWQKYVKAGYVAVNGKEVTSPKFDLTPEDAIAITLPAKNMHEGESLPIVYIDDNVIVINKPAGILTHSKGAMNDEFTVADFFARYSTYAAGTNRPGIIHRLDRDTSGILIGARNEETAQILQKQFSDRTVKKTYVAIVSTRPKLPVATIDVPIARNQAAPSTFKTDVKGKPAQTSYRVVAENDRTALVVLQPKTGRTHQLRVHMKHIGAPIVGDRVYGIESDRLYLHALSLEVTLPGGVRETFSAPVPEDFIAHYSEASNL